ncbi:hypothetical protein GUJ93_ZPchr0001g31776 [Zizania palustris]|uniref:Uncharacterized protein n=1 Tax=Zizania palustris TaxID=103762 RepID=A0A8J5RXP4_ZIZPA|nr:hypothetical protein GUJ93_ZPchr0001g31776 [Zizania palustris]
MKRTEKRSRQAVDLFGSLPRPPRHRTSGGRARRSRRRSCLARDLIDAVFLLFQTKATPSHLRFTSLAMASFRSAALLVLLLVCAAAGSVAAAAGKGKGGAGRAEVECSDLATRGECVASGGGGGGGGSRCRWCRSEALDDMCFGAAEAWRLPHQVFSCDPPAAGAAHARR